MRLTSVLGSAAGMRVRELQQLDSLVRARHPLAARIAFVGVTHGVGTSTSAGLAASVLAARGHRVLAANSAGPGASLLWHAGQPPTAPTSPEEDARRAAATRFADVIEGLPQTTSGVYSIELADSQTSRWHHGVAPISRFFDYAITDWGTRTDTDLASVTAASTVTAVVAPADRSLVQRAVDLAGMLNQSGAVPVIVITDPRNAWTPGWRELANLLPFPAVHLAHDTAHGEDRPRSSRQLNYATRLSGLRLAGLIVQAASTSTAEGTL